MSTNRFRRLAVLCVRVCAATTWAADVARRRACGNALSGWYALDRERCGRVLAPRRRRDLARSRDEVNASPQTSLPDGNFALPGDCLRAAAFVASR